MSKFAAAAAPADRSATANSERTKRDATAALEDTSFAGAQPASAAALPADAADSSTAAADVDASTKRARTDALETANTVADALRQTPASDLLVQQKDGATVKLSADTDSFATALNVLQVAHLRALPLWSEREKRVTGFVSIVDILLTALDFLERNHLLPAPPGPVLRTRTDKKTNTQQEVLVESTAPVAQSSATTATTTTTTTTTTPPPPALAAAAAAAPPPATVTAAPTPTATTAGTTTTPTVAAATTTPISTALPAANLSSPTPLTRTAPETPGPGEGDFATDVGALMDHIDANFSFMSSQLMQMPVSEFCDDARAISILDDNGAPRSAFDVAALLAQPHLHQVAMVGRNVDGDEELLGVCTQGGLIEHMMENFPKLLARHRDTTVASLKLPEQCVSVRSDVSAATAFRAMRDRRVSGIAIVNAAGMFYDVISASDVMLWTEFHAGQGEMFRFGALHKLLLPVDEFLRESRAQRSANPPLLMCRLSDRVFDVVTIMIREHMHRCVVLPDEPVIAPPLTMISFNNVIEMLLRE